MEQETNVKFKPKVEKWKESGEVGRMPAEISVRGDTIKAIWTDEKGVDPYNHREIVTHENLNASYFVTLMN